jgi:hypothetical protein
MTPPRISNQWRATARYQVVLANEAEELGDHQQAALFRAESRENWRNARQLDWEMDLGDGLTS